MTAITRFRTRAIARARTRARWGASGVCVIIFAASRKWVSHAASLEAASLPGNPVGGVCAASGPRRVEGLFSCLPLHCQPRSGQRQGAQRRHQPARATGAAGAHGTPARAGGRAASQRAETPTDQHPRAGAKSPPSACASPAGVACWPPRARGARRAPRARSAAENKITGRARRARTRGATQTNGGAKSSARGGRATGAEAHNYADPPRRSSGGRPRGGRSTARAQEPRARARGAESS